MKIWKKVALVAASTMSVYGSASAACWTPEAVAAAHVRELDTLLMVATLRCHGQGVEISADYNRFVREKRAVLMAANAQLRAQFALVSGEKGALAAFDRYATTIANKYGAGSQGSSCADYQALAQAAVAASADRATLLQLAVRAGVTPSLPVDGACTQKAALLR